ncbi:proteoglycan 4 [Neltuma alba]|uniref:proteoglycan 4 n=1 Tax=Neltuma alba TaxID=207710 RepID=UPI0010A31300|nr:proteoglycan 4-like [Prosopis alba]XP_028806197.1 proteoglycan 4-like [Prosopis alba]
MARRSQKSPRKEHLGGSPNHQGAEPQPTEVNAQRPQRLYPEMESTVPEDPETKREEQKMVKKIEGEQKNEPHQFCNEPDSISSKETITKRVNDLDSKHHELCPKLDPLSSKDSNQVLLPEPGPVVLKNETSGLSAEPDSTTPRKKKRKKGKRLSTTEGAETNDVRYDCELIPNLDPLPQKDSDPALLPEPEPVAERNETNQFCTEPESATPRKKKRRKKSLPTTEGAETNDVPPKHCELIPHLDPLPPKDSGPVLLPEPEPVAEKIETKQLCTEPESATPRKTKRKGKRKNLSKSDATETSHVDPGHLKLCPNLDPLPPKNTDAVLLPEPDPVAEKNETNQLCTEPESATPTITKRKKKRKRKSLSKSEGTETYHVDSGHLELCLNLDPLPPKDSDTVLLPEPESFAEKNETNLLCTEPDSAAPKKTKRKKKKRKSLPKSEGTETNHVNSGHIGLCPNLDPFPPKDPPSVLLPEPEPFAEEKETNQLCTKPDSTPLKFKGAGIKDMDTENPELFPKLDPLPHKDSDPLLLQESKPAPLKQAEQKKKKKNKKKKKKNKGELKGEGVKSNRPNEKHSQRCHKAKPKTPEKRNQKKRKRQVTNENHESSVRSMLIDEYNLRSRGAHSSEAEPGPYVPKWPLKDYEHYERCLECGQICQRDQKCRGRRHRKSYEEICFFCGTVGHPLGRCPISPGAKCANGIIMLDDYVRKKCSEKPRSTYPKVAPAVQTYASNFTHFLPSNIQPYPAPFVRPMYAPFVVWRN